jgi:hypothetical protein
MYYESPHWKAFWEDERGVMMPWCRSYDYNAIKNGTHEWEFFSDLGEFQSFLTETW